MNRIPINLHVNTESFLPATEKEKEYLVKMRPPSTFFKDGINRLAKNKVALISLIIIILIKTTNI